MDILNTLKLEYEKTKDANLSQAIDEIESLREEIELLQEELKHTQLLVDSIK